MTDSAPEKVLGRTFEATFGHAEQVSAIFTYLILIAIIFIVQVAINEGAIETSIPSWLFLIPISAVAGIWLYSPREYSFREDYIEIKRAVMSNKIYYHQIDDYVIYNEAYSGLKDSLLLPIHFLPHIRKFHDSRFSIVKVYANRFFPSIILKTINGAYLLSCEDTSGFATELRKKVDLSKRKCPCGDTLIH